MTRTSWPGSEEAPSWQQDSDPIPNSASSPPPPAAKHRPPPASPPASGQGLALNVFLRSLPTQTITGFPNFMTRMGQDEGDPPPATTFWYLATDLYPSLNLILGEAPKREKNNQKTTASGFLKHPTSSRAHDDLVSAFQASPAQLLVAAAGCAGWFLGDGFVAFSQDKKGPRLPNCADGGNVQHHRRVCPNGFPSPNPMPEPGGDASFGSNEPWG